MSPRLRVPPWKLIVSLHRPRLTPLVPGQFLRAHYSTETTEPLIRVTELPAPNTGHIRILELNRPSARNAISRALLAALREEVDFVNQQYDPATGDEVPTPSWNMRFGGLAGESEKGPTRALIISSAVESSFCAGADLKERKEFTQEETTQFLASLRSTFASLAALPIPTISAISSRALGGGLELALSTHFRVLTSNAIVGLPETRLGIIPGAGGTHRLPALIGFARARDLVVTGRAVSAPEAYFLGLADRLVEVVPPEDGEMDPETGEPLTEQERQKAVLLAAQSLALSEAVRLAGEICEGGPVAVRAALQAVQAPSPEMEGRMYERIIGTEDRNEALSAFAQKRKPVFKGR